MDSFANNLQVLRKSREMTQDKLAAALGVDRQTVSNWENETQQPTFAMALQIADFFGVTTDDLAHSTMTLSVAIGA